MNIKISGKNITVTNALKEHVRKKLGKLDRYFDEAIEAQVTMNVEKDRHIVEVTIPMNGIILRGETETNDMYASVDLVVEKLEKQIEKYKTRIARSTRKGTFKFNGSTQPPSAEKKADIPRVVKVKRFAIKPMDVEEATMQMDLLQHDFFVFLNAETNEVNVVYKRKDGNYGLIEPELS
ncbi:MAG TPA: ribosome-associated translation inhibitor RaiA [Thermoanaerobacterales bacterium]|jgi:putative sigma-54 modulation protein|nr:ribosome-associated translation inhibitor RaiA [Thermoanaerobacterales bacterium]